MISYNKGMEIPLLLLHRLLISCNKGNTYSIVAFLETSVFEHLLTMKDDILLVYKKGLYYPFEKHVFDCTKGSRSLIDKEQAYLTARVSGIICGLVNEWIRRGMTDPPAYVAGFLRRRTEYKAGE